MKKGEGRVEYCFPTTGTDYVARCAWTDLQLAIRIMCLCNVEVISLLSSICITAPLIDGLKDLEKCGCQIPRWLCYAPTILLQEQAMYILQSSAVSFAASSWVRLI